LAEEIGHWSISTRYVIGRRLVDHPQHSAAAARQTTATPAGQGIAAEADLRLPSQNEGYLRTA
jgi:hypothetical protein